MPPAPHILTNILTLYQPEGVQIMPTTLLRAIFRPSYGPDKTMQAETMHLVFTVCNLNNFKTIELTNKLLECLKYHKSAVQLPNQLCIILQNNWHFQHSV